MYYELNILEGRAKFWFKYPTVLIWYHVTVQLLDG